MHCASAFYVGLLHSMTWTATINTKNNTPANDCTHNFISTLQNTAVHNSKSCYNAAVAEGQYFMPDISQLMSPQAN